jgi:hypothetical protein
LLCSISHDIPPLHAMHDPLTVVLGWLWVQKGGMAWDFSWPPDLFSGGQWQISCLVNRMNLMLHGTQRHHGGINLHWSTNMGPLKAHYFKFSNPLSSSTASPIPIDQVSIERRKIFHSFWNQCLTEKRVKMFHSYFSFLGYGLKTEAEGWCWADRIVPYHKTTSSRCKFFCSLSQLVLFR